MKLDKLDILFSEFVRKRAILRAGGCERCKRPYFDTQKDDGSIYPAYKYLQCAHLIDRSKHSTRWDEMAAAGLCGGCHMFIDRDHRAKEQFCLELLGEEEYDNLLGRAGHKPDKKLLMIYYKELVKSMV